MDYELLKFKPSSLAEIDKDCFYFVLESTSEKGEVSFGPQHFYSADVLRKIVYNESAKTEVDKMLKEDSSQEGVNREDYRLLASYIKNGKFSIENEVRASFCYNYSNDGSVTKINYRRLKNGGLRPYVKVQISIRKESKNFEPCLPLKSITVGPSGIQQTIFDSVVHRIKYGECKVYNYLKDKQKLVKNFSCYLFEVYCKDKDIKVSSNLEFGAWIYREDVTLSKNIFDALNSLNFKQNENQEKDSAQINDFWPWILYNQKLISALINNWIEENRALLFDYNIEEETFDYNMEEETDVKTDKKLKDKLDLINQNFYFSKEGILIRKSKIPYIF